MIKLVDWVEKVSIVLLICFLNCWTDCLLPIEIENPTYARQQAIVGPFKKVTDVARTLSQFISSRGFNHDVHWVTTKDGYILQIYRMWSRFAAQAMGQLKPILLIHGLLYSGSSWFMASRDGHVLPWTHQGQPPNDTSSGLAYHLANKGFEVWILNNRGTSYSTNHTRYDPFRHQKFWEYSFFDMGVYDLPATTDYIKKYTRLDQISLLGYSQGTLQTFIKLSLDPGYAKNYNLIIMAAPVAFLGQVKGMVSMFPRRRATFRSLNVLRSLRMPSRLAQFDATMTLRCQRPSNEASCANMLGHIGGVNLAQLNTTRLPVYMSQMDSTSGKNMLHFLQTIHYGQVRYFDYGSSENLIRYKATRPPKIPLSNIPTHKLVLISGLNDYLSTPEDIQKLRATLKGVPLVDYVIPDPFWNHLDFQIAMDGYSYFNNIVGQILNTYLNSTVTIN